MAGKMVQIIDKVTSCVPLGILWWLIGCSTGVAKCSIV